MQLRRIEVRAFRKLDHLVIEGLSDGLNVIVGDNETGKSTLLAALRTVLFERHRVGGRVLEAMLPRGHEVRPEIAIDFSLRGEPYRLRKAFNQRPEAMLTLPGGGSITGDAVEERLADLLGFAAPGSRGSKPEEHQGVYGLLWVDQGISHGPLTAGAGQEPLSAALESEVGQVVGGERGRHLLALAEARRDALWDKRGKPRGLFRQAQERVDELAAARDATEARVRLHDQQVAALAAKADILARYARENRLAIAAQEVEAARGAERRATQLNATLLDLRQAHRRALLDRETAAERQRARQALASRLDSAALATADVGAQAGGAQAALLGAEQAARDAGTARQAARQALEAADARIEAYERHAARLQAADEYARRDRDLREAEVVSGRRREALATVARLPITAADLSALDARIAARDQAQSRRDAASVQIVFEALDGATIEVDGAAHEFREPLRLARDAVLDLSGFGRLRVRPGGGVVPLARALDEAEAAVAAMLRKLGQPSRRAAAADLARKTEAEAEVAAQQRLLAHLAPQGLDVLRRAVETLAAVTATAPPEEPPPIADGAALRRQREVARSTEAAAEAEARRNDGQREATARHAAVLAERVAAARRDQQDLIGALATARVAAPDDALVAALADHDRTAGLAAQAVAAAEAALATADPETACLALKRAEAAERAIRADIDVLSRDKRDLEVELRTLGQDGFGEELAHLEGQLATARRQLAAQALEAEASRLLHATLTAAQRETKDRWLGPVRDRVRPYLRLIHPDSEIVLNQADFSIQHLLRDGVPEPFESLSVGAREQVAVITRLALADVLRGAGQPTAIILDDALVNTDEDRLGRMHLVLQKAAEKLQVLVLTCRAQDFLGLGAPIHRL